MVDKRERLALHAARRLHKFFARWHVTPLFARQLTPRSTPFRSSVPSAVTRPLDSRVFGKLRRRHGLWFLAAAKHAVQLVVAREHFQRREFAHFLTLARAWCCMHRIACARSLVRLRWLLLLRGLRRRYAGRIATEAYAAVSALIHPVSCVGAGEAVCAASGQN